MGVLVGTANFANAKTYTAFTYSSQATAAQASNILQGVRRSKTWRSAGYWEISSANNVLIFRESVGVDKTATVAASNYTTDATFLAAIQAAMNSAGSSTYTVSRDATTKKIKIVSNGSGGGGIFQIKSTNVLSTLASIIGLNTAADYTGALTYLADTLKIHTSEWLELDLGSAAVPKMMGLLGPRGSVFGLSSSAVITLMGNPTSSWTSPAYSQAVTRDDFGALLANTSGIGTYRRWRLKIVDPSNPHGYVEIAKWYLGEVASLAKGSAQFPLDGAFEDPSVTDYADAGVSFSTKKPITKTFRVIWKFLSVADNEALTDFFEDVQTTTPFFICMDPNQVFSSTPTRNLLYCKFAKAMDFPFRRANQFEQTWQLREEN